MSHKLLPGLTLRQTEVAMLTAQGVAGTDIANILRIHPVVVRYHRSRIYDRLGFRSLAQLGQWVYRHSFIEFMLPTEEQSNLALNTAVPGFQLGSPDAASKPGKARGASGAKR